MGDVIHIAVCLVTGFFFGVFAAVVAIVLIEDIYTKKEKGNKKDD